MVPRPRKVNSEIVRVSQSLWKVNSEIVRLSLSIYEIYVQLAYLNSTEASELVELAATELGTSTSAVTLDTGVGVELSKWLTRSLRRD